MLSEKQLASIDSVLASRVAIRPLTVLNPDLQPPASQSQIFELQRQHREHYYFRPTTASMDAVPSAEGAFLFVILATDPLHIYCGAPTGSFVAKNARFEIVGHTSLSYREDVLYAGEIFLEHGRLLSWSNGSGHYTPPAFIRSKNILPPLRLLLPDEKFVDFWNMTAAQRGPALEMRGYLDMAIK